VICYTGLRIPQRAVVLLPVDSDAVCTSLNGHSARKMQYFFMYGARKPHVIENNIREGTDCTKQWYNKPTCGGCINKNCGLGNQ